MQKFRSEVGLKTPFVFANYVDNNKTVIIINWSPQRNILVIAVLHL